MNKYFKFLIPVLAVILFTSSASAQWFPGRDRDDDDRYEDRRYEDNRYGTDRYGNNRYGSNWMDVARTRVSRNDGYERVNLNSRYGNVRQLLFRTDGPVNVYRVAVRYSNGRTEELNVRSNRYDRRRDNRNYNNDLVVSVPSRGYSDVRQVMFWYDSDRYSRSRSTINVYAR